jgi:hypothetical protein
MKFFSDLHDLETSMYIYAPYLCRNLSFARVTTKSSATWSSSNTAGRIMWPLRPNGKPYSGINILMIPIANSSVCL